MAGERHTPFDGDIELLDAWTTFLRSRRLRVEADWPLTRRVFASQGAPAHDPDDDLWRNEKTAWDTLQGRLEAHRADRSAPPLGLERLRLEHDLCPDEMIILAAVAICAISEPLAVETFGSGASTCGPPVGELMLLLDPEQSPWRIEDWLRWRVYFRDDSKLVAAGFVAFDRGPRSNPGELLDAYMHITNEGFRQVTGFEP